MDNIIQDSTNQQPLPSQHQAEQPQTSPSSSAPSKTFKILVGVLLLALVIIISYTLGTKQNQPVVQNNQTTTSPTITQPSPTPDETADWKTYTINTLQLQFRLPPKFASLGELKEDVEFVSPPFTGKRLCVTFTKKTSFVEGNCEMNYFVILAISSDYNVGRGAGFGDLQGFTYRDTNYYAQLLRTEFEIPSNLVQRINNKNGVEIIKIKSTYTPSEDEPLPIYYVGENIVGALVNTSDKAFPGFAVLFELKDGFTETDFEQILSTFQFSN